MLTSPLLSIRRSGAISETFTWDVAFDTSFDKIEALRSRMLEFLEIERRDFLPMIDIAVKGEPLPILNRQFSRNKQLFAADFAGQGKIELSADIKYKSNWQNGALKAQRRNKWCCALKLAMCAQQLDSPRLKSHAELRSPHF